jgi:hypothetical protein
MAHPQNAVPNKAKKSATATQTNILSSPTYAQKTIHLVGKFESNFHEPLRSDAPAEQAWSGISRLRRD